MAKDIKVQKATVTLLRKLGGYQSLADWIQRKLGLKVNMTKTHIARPQKLKYLGFGFYKDSKTKEWKSRPHEDSVARLKGRLKELTCKLFFFCDSAQKSVYV